MRDSFQIGDAIVTRLDEFESDQIDPHFLYPDLQDELSTHGAKLTGEALNPTSGNVTIAVHPWLVQLPGRTILIDPGVGNDKDIPDTLFDRWNSAFLDKLAAAGVRPEQVDLVVMSHLHADHVGWNTRRQGETWVPTFTNARHHLSGVERRYQEALLGTAPAPDLPPATLGTAATTPETRNYPQSVTPILAAGLVDIIDEVDGTELADGLSLISTPGHSIDHASLRLRSRGEEALFIADVMHNPLQAYAPHLRSVFCEFPEPALASRMKILEMAAESGATCFAAHFGGSAAGKISRAGDNFAWRFI